MLHVILYAIVPIIVVMSVGFIAGKKGAFSGGDAKAFNKVGFISTVSANRVSPRPTPPSWPL